MLHAPSARTSQKQGPRGNSIWAVSWNAPLLSSTTTEPPRQWAKTKSFRLAGVGIILEHLSKHLQTIIVLFQMRSYQDQLRQRLRNKIRALDHDVISNIKPIRDGKDLKYQICATGQANSMCPMRSRRTLEIVTSTPHFSHTTPRCFKRLYLPHRHS